MNLASELKKIDQVGATAWALVMEGDYRGARRVMRKIADSLCVTESERVLTIIEAKIFERKGEKAQAKERILASLVYVWGSEEAFEILSCEHPRSDSNTTQFYLEVTGGSFLGFPSNCIASFDVLANSKTEALEYVRTLSISPHLSILRSDEMPRNEELRLRRGVLRAYPFRR